uniref:Myb/SANT-like domain-containing protein n=1 Tax=Lactuca sativa TaxID=4236 RepID=A0A9R1VJ46_LACSA|nr:hypothetical protein LSAT_V11C500233590 [Lactuca sativa]
MAPNKDTEGGITWNNENAVKFCEVCIDYITKNGRGQLMRWREMTDLFAEKISKQFNLKSLKKKYDSMKKDWRLWKILKIGETGLGLNTTTGKLDCSDEWWDRKLKVLLRYLYLETRCKEVPPQRSLFTSRRKWDHLFGDVVAIGAGCVSPSLNLEFVDKSINVVDKIQNENGWSNEAMREYSQYSRLENLDNQENSFWTNFTEEVGIFLYTVALGLSNRYVAERFQRFGETISRAFHDVLESICGRGKGFMGLAREYIRPKDVTFHYIPSHIENNTYMPYFKDCIGCIDGTHIDACITMVEQMRYKGRK